MLDKRFSFNIDETYSVSILIDIFRSQGNNHINYKLLSVFCSLLSSYSVLCCSSWNVQRAADGMTAAFENVSVDHGGLDALMSQQFLHPVR
jgi:rhodanese-related sulfurtransferase